MRSPSPCACSATDELALPSGAAEAWDSKKKFSATTTATGKVTRTLYVTPVGRSSLEVFKSHRDALAAKGFTPVSECAKEACGEQFFALKYRWNNKAAQPLGPTPPFQTAEFSPCYSNKFVLSTSQ